MKRRSFFTAALAVLGAPFFWTAGRSGIQRAKQSSRDYDEYLRQTKAERKWRAFAASQRTPEALKEREYLENGHFCRVVGQLNVMTIVTREGDTLLAYGTDCGEFDDDCITYDDVTNAINYFERTGGWPKSMVLLRSLQRALQRAQEFTYVRPKRTIEQELDVEFWS